MAGMYPAAGAHKERAPLRVILARGKPEGRREYSGYCLFFGYGMFVF